MDARARLDAAKTAMREGRHAEALEGFVWFHEHALEESPSWSGVRLSFALRAWIDLAVFYPPAMVALRATRDRTVAALLRGDGGRRAFRDVVSIDEYLQEPQQTYQLFLTLEEHDAVLAQGCGYAARDAMIAAGDFTRAAAVAPDFEATIQTHAADLHASLASIKASFARAPARWAFICNYVDDIHQVLAIARGTGQLARAVQLEQVAVALLESPSVRRDVRAGMVKRPKAPNAMLRKWRLAAQRTRQRETAARRQARRHA